MPLKPLFVEYVKFMYPGSKSLTTINFDEMQRKFKNNTDVYLQNFLQQVAKFMFLNLEANRPPRLLMEHYLAARNRDSLTCLECLLNSIHNSLCNVRREASALNERF